VAVAAKDAAMKAVQRRAAALAAVVYATDAVGDAQLVSLGLLPRPTRAARHAPATPPTMAVASVMGRVVKVRIHARTTEGTRLAAGAVGANVYSYVGDEPPTDPKQYHYHGLATRATSALVFPDDVPSGATAWVSASWVSRRGETSTACTPVRVTIQGGPVLARVPAASLNAVRRAA
jgi:hypothetical protein